MRLRPALPLAAALGALALSACTWVPIQPEAQQVRVLRDAPANCQKVGEIEVEVTDKVALYRRSALKVADELETLARNQAAGIPATAIHPLSPPADGKQKFAAWRCPR